MLVSSIARSEGEREVLAYGSIAIVGCTNTSSIGSLEDYPPTGAPNEDSTLGRLLASFLRVDLCLRKVAPKGAMICINSRGGKRSMSKCNSTLCKKTRKNKSCDLALLIYTSKIVIIKREGKQIGASVMRAYKKTHLSIEIVCMCEMG